jgi:hypothetical protein
MEEAFEAFASFGGAHTKEMDNAHFAKMCKEAGLVDKNFTTVDVDMIFTKVKSKGARKINFKEFEQGAIPEIAKKKKTTDQAIAEKIASAAPQSSGTKADAVKFHDDKSQYTGVYKAGGPTNVDRNSGDLSAITDRRVSNDIRGATTSLPPGSGK